MRQRLIRTMAIWGAFLVFLMIFRPGSLPVVVLIIPFVLLFSALYSLWILLATLRATYVLRDSNAQVHRQLGAVICVGIVLLTVLQSLGQLTVRDVVTLAAVIGLGYLYLARSQFNAPKR